MKKFLVSIICVALVVLGTWYAVYFKGFYITTDSSKETQVVAKIKDKDILINGEKFIIKGVDLPSNIAGHHATDYAIDYDTYIRWFQAMQDMGANAIRVYTIYNDTFYNAFYDYNKNHEKPLYLLQGIQVTDYANDCSQDAYGQDFYASLKQDAMDIIDVVHGMKIISTNKVKGSGEYTHDISRWVLGYIVGNTWDAGTIKYTNQQDYIHSFQGQYFQTTSQATAFETLLARIMDQMMTYENDKYNRQSLITFTSSPEIDPFEYEKEYARQLGKMTTLNIEHIQSTSKLKSGYFASYQLFDYCKQFYQCFTPKQKEEVKSIYNQIDQTRYYQGYSELLQKYHSVPVVISGFGYSSSRGNESMEGPLNEVQQGKKIVETYNDIIESGCSGAFIDSWQDNWDKLTWNTSYALNLNNIYRWHDIQSQSTSYGLIGFQSHDMMIDGNNKDWVNKQVIVNQKDLKLSMCTNEKGIYLFVEKNDLSRNDDIYIAIDTTHKSGSIQYNHIQMNKPADFIIHIKGNKGEILVQSRYESLRENYLSQIQNKDPFESYPTANDKHFTSVSMICKNEKLTHSSMSDKEILETKKNPVYPTGKLREGHQKQNSLADYCYGETGLELLIPWQMINVSDPIYQLIHDDYYVHYGVEHLQVSDISIGLSFNKTASMNLQTVELPSLDDLTFKEYYKKSYDIVKESWCQ